MRAYIAICCFLFSLPSVFAQMHEYDGSAYRDSVLIMEGDTVVLQFGSLANKNLFGNAESLLDGDSGEIGSMDLDDVFIVRVGCRAKPVEDNLGASIQLFLRPKNGNFLTKITGVIDIDRQAWEPVGDEVVFWSGAPYAPGAELVVVGVEGRSYIKNADMFIVQIVDASEAQSEDQVIVHQTPDTVFNSTSWSNLSSTEAVLSPGIWKLVASGRWTAGAVGDISLGWFSPNSSGIDLFSWSRDHDNVSGNDRSLNQSENGNGVLNAYKRFYFRGTVVVSAESTVGMRMRQRGIDLVPTILGMTVIEWTKIQ